MRTAPPPTRALRTWRRWGRIAWLGVWLLSAHPAFAETHLPPGLEPLISRLLAGPDDLGPCQLGDVSVQATQLDVAVTVSGQRAHLALVPVPLSDGPTTTSPTPLQSRSLRLALPPDRVAELTPCAQALMARIAAADDGALERQIGQHAVQEQRTDATRQKAPQVNPQSPPSTHPWLLALAFLVLPIAVGWLLARLLRGRPLVLQVSLVVLPLPLLLTATALGWRPPLAFWDLAVAALGVSAMTGLGLCRLTWGRWTLLVGSTLLTGLLAEVAVRTMLPAPPEVPPPADARPLFGAGQLDMGCVALFAPNHDPDDAQHVGDPMWVHLGDSMVAGNGVRREETFVAALNRRHEGVWHRNAASPGTTLDTHWLWLKLHLAERKPARVVVHTLVLNDVAEMDRPYTCCDLAPLVDYTPTGMQPHCTEPKLRVPMASLVARSPAPYPVRVLASVSWLARFAVAAATTLGGQLERTLLNVHVDSDDGTPEQWAHYKQALVGIAALTREAGVPLTLVVLPSRRALETAHPETTVAQRTRLRMVQLARDAGIEVLDAWDLFAERVRSDGSPPWFVTPPAWDCHFSPRGHALFADWLAAQLPPRAH